MIAGIRNIIVNNAQQAKDFYQRIEELAKTQIIYYRSESEKLELQIRNLALSELTAAMRDVETLLGNNQYFALQIIKQAKQQTEQYLRETLIQSPSKTLERGYAIVRLNGHAINSVHQLKNQTVSIELKDGKAEATVNQIKENTL